MSPDSAKRSPIPAITTLSASLALALVACTSEESPTQPGMEEDSAPVSAAVAATSNTWTTVSPGFDLSRIAAGVAANSAGQDILYTFGGFNGIRDALNRVGAYNPATDTWTYKDSPKFETARFYTNGVGKLGNKLYFSGGYNSIFGGVPVATKTLWAYDYANHLMIRKADLPIAGAEGVSGVINGKLYVLPGACGGDRYPEPGYCAVEATRRFYRYDPTTNTWISRAQAPHFHRLGAGGVINGKFYVVGGNDNGQLSAHLDVYDPANNTWRTLAPIPTAGGGIGAVIQGGLFVIQTNGKAYFYNPATNTWKARTAPKVGHSAVGRVLLNGRAHLIATGGSHLGEFDEDEPNGTERYTP